MSDNDSNVIPDRILARELLRYAVQRQIFSPYGGEVLDVRRAVLLDGTDHGAHMTIMTGPILRKEVRSLTADYRAS